MLIAHNLIAMNISNNLNKANNNKSKSMEKLSSGVRINKASDDSAGLAISQKMKAQIRGLQQAQKNIQDGISFTQTIEGGLGEIQDPNLQRMRELAVQASNGTLTSEDRIQIQNEIEQIKSGIDNIANNTEYNGIKTLKGDYSGEIIPATPSEATISMNIPNSYSIVSGNNDTLKIDIDGIANMITLNPGIYSTPFQIIDEINNEFTTNGINCTASYSQGSLKFVNNTAGLSHSVENISGNFIQDSITINQGTNISSIDYQILIGTSDNIHNAKGIDIIAGFNDELNLYIDGVDYSITITPGHYSGSSQYLYDDINGKLSAQGANVKITDVWANWDNSHMRTYLYSLDNSNHDMKVSGSAFSDLFCEENLNLSDNVRIWGREADFSAGYQVVTGLNDTLNFKVDGVNKTIVLNSGAYSRDGLVTELNNQFSSVGADITASMGGAIIGSNSTGGPGNTHYMLELTHNQSGTGHSIQVISGNALDQLFLNNAKPGDVWTPQSATTVQGNKDLSSGVTITSGVNDILNFSIDNKISKTVNIPSGTYTASDFLIAFNSQLNQISAGIKASYSNGELVLTRERNGSNYTVGNFSGSAVQSILSTIITFTHPGTDEIKKMNLKLQIGSNANDTMSISIADVRCNSLGIDKIVVDPQEKAEEAISSIDNAIRKISSERGKCGSYQNALEHVLNNVSNYNENLTGAVSRIEDTDMAKEMMEMSKNNILEQATESLLAQANQMPNKILDLLK